MSSYDELVHDPISAAEMAVGTPLASAHAPTSLDPVGDDQGSPVR